MHIFVTDFDGTEHKLEAIEGWRVMEIIRDWQLPIKAECGGCCSCATCHVYVDEAWMPMLSEPEAEEWDRLDEAFEVTENSRLSCQIILSEQMNGLKVTMAPGSGKD